MNCAPGASSRPAPRDLPRNRIIREHPLWPLAKSQPDNLAALGKIEDMHPRTVRQDGQFCST